MKEKYEHPVQFTKTWWELLAIAAAKEQKKQKKPITIAAYVRQVMARHLNHLNKKE